MKIKQTSLTRNELKRYARNITATTLPVLLLLLSMAPVGHVLARGTNIQHMLGATTNQSITNPSPSLLPQSTVIVAGSGGVAVNPITGLVYVTNPGARTLTVIDSSTNTIIDTIVGGTQPRGVAVNPNTNMVYVTDFGTTVQNFGLGRSLIVIDGSTDAIVANITVGWGPFGVAVDPNTNMIYVANSAQNTVSIINGSTNTVVGTAGAGWYPSAIAVNTANDQVYVVSGWDDAVTVIGGPAIGVGYSPAGVAINPSTDKIYVTNHGHTQGDSVTVIDGRVNYATTINGVLNPIPVGPAPSGIGIDTNTNMIYVANNDGTISIINALTNVDLGNYQLGGGSANSIAVNTSTNTVYVTTASNNLYILNSIVGDVNGDCKVTVVDLATVAIAYASRPGSPNWNPKADVTGDGVVNILDLALVAINYGKAC